MKKVITLLSIGFFICIAQLSHAQGKQDDAVILKAGKVIISGGPEIQCKEVVYDNNLKQMTLLGDVAFKTDRFRFENAAKAVYNESTKKITVFECKKFTIRGNLVVGKDQPGKNIIEYTIGDDTVYVF